MHDWNAAGLQELPTSFRAVAVDDDALFLLTTAHLQASGDKLEDRKLAIVNALGDDFTVSVTSGRTRGGGKGELPFLQHLGKANGHTIAVCCIQH